MKRLAVEDVVSCVVDRLAIGMYPTGSKLPTSRELALEIGVHRNTVAKAYQSLVELGLVTMKQGRGTYVATMIHGQNQEARFAKLNDDIANSIVEGRRLGVSEETVRQLVDEHLATVYRSPPLRGAFTECNTEDLMATIAEIEQMTSLRLAPLYLEDIGHSPVEASAGFDVIFTSLFHIIEVRELLAEVRPSTSIVGLYTQPDENAIAEIAHIKSGSRVGIIVSNLEGGHRYVAQINTFTSVTTDILVCPTNEEILTLASNSDVIVYSRSRLAQIRRLDIVCPTIGLSFHISPESANRVVESLASSPKLSV